MEYTIIDIESTGLLTYSAKPLTVSYLKFEKLENGRLKTGDSGTLFFWQDNWVIPEEASAVNGLTANIMRPYAAEYNTSCRKLYQLIQRGWLAGQNIKSYDIPLMRAHFERERYPEINIDEVVDTRYMFGKSRSMDTLKSELGITEEAIQFMHKRCFKNSPFSEISAHNSEHDVTATYLVLVNAYSQGKVVFK